MMKSKEKKYLSFYERYAPKNTLPEAGLCECFTSKTLEADENIDLFEPPDDACSESLYWGASDLKDYYALRRSGKARRHYDFTKLRQNIVLFCAAMEGEL